MRIWGQRFHPDRPVVYQATIPKGPAGTSWTVRYVAGLVRAGAKDPFVRRVAVRVFRSFGVAPKDYEGEVLALFEWVRGTVRYTRDTYRVELLQTPRRTLVERAGDCDDMTILLGALLEATGHPIRLVIVGFDARRPDRFSHIYLETLVGPRWIPLDPTMSWPIGSAPPARTRKVIELPRGRDMWIGGTQTGEGWDGYGDYGYFEDPLGLQLWPRSRRSYRPALGMRQRQLLRRLALLRRRLRRQRYLRRRRHTYPPFTPQVQLSPLIQPMMMPYYAPQPPSEAQAPPLVEMEEDQDQAPATPASQAPPATGGMAGWAFGWGRHGIGGYGWPMSGVSGYPAGAPFGYSQLGFLPAAAALGPALLPLGRRLAPSLIRSAAPLLRRFIRGGAPQASAFLRKLPPGMAPLISAASGAILQRRLARIERLLHEVLRRRPMAAVAQDTTRPSGAAPPTSIPAQEAAPGTSAQAAAAPQMGFYW